MINLVNLFDLLPSAGDPKDLVDDLKDKLNWFAVRLNSEIIITSGYRPQSDGSQHQFGKAADLMFPDSKLSLLQLYHLAEQCGFQGIGVYPDWKLNGVKLGGLHVDVRDTSGPHAKWMGVNQGGGKQIYIALNEENLAKFGVV